MKNHYRVVALFLFLIALGGCATSGNYKEKDQSLAEDTFKPLSSPEFNIPIVINKEVEAFIRYFQTSNRRHFVRWLERSERYIPMMQEILAQNNLPTDLVYMAMIESGFNTSAYSRARAVGPWQFIKGTASRYGLKINWWVDERRDPTKSTLAASMYLKDLYDMFDSWLLAAAGYNAGENKIKRAIVKHNTEDFWEMTNHRYLRKETKQYIPKLIAAALIAKNPPKYGFTNLEYQDPLEFETITVTEPTDLRTLAQMLVSPYEDIKILNPELLRWCTPPDTPEYTLRIPKGKKEVFEAKALEGEPQSKEKTIFHSHKIKQGDTLYQIARTYGIQVSPIIEMNKLKSTHTLRPGQFLIIPVKAKSSDQQT
ncbi:MAG: hypothetical protein A2Z91_03130 [Deltaproteobacteria bacterium GWA2_38_16]|nr:MAG: hypothetical protein A2Z91_03130 [Deltaproteobacteria bacterium GWA2_38_16]OGQ02879.1 MAG: hypothetical protein A3D19_06555 [Deltaproteobacteria bacterium RIFCSPHIGHO2_02_FULL_38_15]HBQ21725.1 hypothetical protein [Deltaproteobacteria bacterium]